MGVNVSYINNVLADSIVGFSGIYDLPENFKDIKLTDLTSISGENFGLSICMSDLYLTVGSPLYNLDENGQNQLTNSGAVFIFKRNVDTWEYFKTIFAPTRTSNENFGYSVSNTDKIIVVGTNGTSKSYIYNIELKDVSLIETLMETSSTNAYGNSVYCTDDNVFISDINSSTDPDGNSLPSSSGAVYIYNETNNWNRTQKLCISNGDITSNDQLGNSIDLLNDTVAVSSISRSYDENNLNYLKNSGSVYILSITQSGISLIKEIVSPSRTVNAQFGKKVLFNSNGGLFVSDNKNLYFYNINSNGTWEYVSTLIDNSSTSFVISDYDINDFFVVSGYNGTTSVINLYKFNNTTNTLTSITSYTPVHNIDSNTKISTIDNMILVGNSSYNTNTGIVDLLTITSDINSETSAVTYSITSQSINGFDSDRNSGDDFGNNILYNDLSKTIIVSAPNNSYDNNIENYISESGSVYIWKINNDGTLTNTQKITSENRIENGLFGSIMATSNSLLVIPDSISTRNTIYNINVYKFNNGIWELDNKIPSEILLNSQISTDGTNIAWFSNNSGVSNIRVVNYIQSVTDITTIDISSLTDSIYNHNISILGDTILVIDPHSDINGDTGQNYGTVFVYKNTNNIWSKYGTISGWGQSRNSNDLFGSQVICKNNYMYISAPNYSYDINAKNYISNSGLVYVYTLKSDGTYSLSQKIQSNYRSSNTGTYSFGFTIAASDTNVLYISNKYSSSSSGWIEEFILVNGKYEFSQYIGTPTTASNTTNLGDAVWWYEDILFISMIGTSVTSYIQDSTGKWNLDNTFKRTDISQTTYDSSDSFGAQIKYKKGLLLISAYTDNYDSQGNNSLSSAGSVYIYNNTPQNSKNVWTPVQKIAGQVFVTGKQAGDLFGQVVSYYNGYIIVSSPGNSYDVTGQNYVSSSGAVYLFTVDSDGNLVQKQKIVSPNRTSNGQFGKFIKVVNDRLYILGETNLYEYIFNNNSYTYNSTISIPDIQSNNISISGNFLVYWNEHQNFVVLSRNTDNTWNNIASIVAGPSTTATIYDDILIHNYFVGATLHVYKLNKNTVTKLYDIDPIGVNNPSITNVYSKNNKLFLSDTTNNLVYVFDINSTDGSYTFSQVLSIGDIKNSLNTYNNSTSSQFGNTVKLSDNNILAIGFKNASYTINSDVSNTPYNNAGAVILYNLSDNSTKSSKNIKTFTTDSTFTVSDTMTGKIRFHIFGDIGTNTNNTNLNNYVCFEENVVSGTVYRMFIGNQGVNTIASFNGFTDTSNKISGAATIIRKNDSSENIVIVGGATTSTTPLDSYYNTTSPENSTYKYTGGNGYKIGISGDNGSNGSNYIDSNLTVLENFYNISSTDKLSALKTQFSMGNYGSVVIEYVEVSESSFGKFEFLQDITPQNINDYNTSDQFGTSLDITNNLLVVTSQNNNYDQNGENTSNLTNTGAAWIYSNTSGLWKQEQKIVPTGTNARNSNDYFGAACSIFNGMVIVSSVNHSYDISGNNSSNLTNVGAAWIWSKDTANNTWKQIDKLCPLGSENATDYNFSIDKHNNEIVIGSPTANSNGSVYIVNVDSNNNITFNQKIVSPKPYTNGNFGYKVKYYNSKLYISEPGYTTIDTTGILTTGIVYEFTLNSDTNVYEVSNTITSEDTNILTLGYDFDIANDKMVIGCPNSYNSIKNNGLLFSKYSSYEKYISCKDINSSWAGIQASLGYDFTATIFKILLTFNNPLYITRVLSQINSENILDFYIDFDFSIDDNIKINMLYNGIIYKIDTNLNITSINGIDTYLSLSQTKNNIILTFGTFTYNISNLPTNNTSITTTYYIGNNGTYINNDEFVVKSIYSTWQPSSTSWSSYNNIVYSNGSFSQTIYVIDSTRPIGFSTIDGGTASIVYNKGNAIIYDITSKKILSTLSPKDYSDTINGTQFGYSVSIDPITSDIVVGFPSDNSVSGSGISSDIQTNIGSAYVYEYNSENNNYTFSKRIGAYGNDQYYPVSQNIEIENKSVSTTETVYYKGYLEISSKDSYIKYNGPIFGTPTYGISLCIYIPTDASTVTRIFTQGSTYIDIDCTSTTPVVSAHYVYGTTNTSTSISSNASKGNWWWISLYYWNGNGATNLRVNNSSNSSYVGGTSYSNQSQSMDFYIGPNTIYDTYDNIIIGGIAQTGNGKGSNSYFTTSDGSINYFDDYYISNIGKDTAYSTTYPPSNISYIENKNVENYDQSTFTQIINGQTTGIIDPNNTETILYEPVMYFPYSSDYQDHSGNGLPVTTNNFSFGTAAGDFPQLPSAKFMLTNQSYSTYSVPFNENLTFDKSFSFCGWFAQWGGNSNNIKCDTFSIDITGASASDEGYYGINLHIAGQTLTISNIPGKNNGGSAPFIAISYDSITKNVILYCNNLSTNATLTTTPTINASQISYSSICAFSNVRLFGMTALTLDDMNNLFSDINYNYPVTTVTVPAVNYYNGIYFSDNTGYVKYSAPAICNSISNNCYYLKMVIKILNNGSNTTRLFSQPEINNYIDITLSGTSSASLSFSILGTTGTYIIGTSLIGEWVQLIMITNSTTIWCSVQALGSVSGTVNSGSVTPNSKYTGIMYDTYIGNNSAYSSTDDIIIGGFEILSYPATQPYDTGTSDGYLSLRSTECAVNQVIDYTQGNTTTIYNGYPVYKNSKDMSVSDSLLITQAQSISSKSVMSLPSSSTETITNTTTYNKNYDVIQQTEEYIILSYITDSYDTQGNNYLPSSGAIHIWTYDSTSESYKFTQRLTSPNRVSNGEFGKNISLDNGKLLVSAPGENLGLLYVYEATGKSPYVWQLTETIDISSISKSLGYVLNTDFTNNQFVLGDPDYIDSVNGYYGRVIVCDKSSGTWKFSIITNTHNINTSIDTFGFNTKINGNYLAIESNNILNDNNDSTNAQKSLYVYTKTNNEWNFVKKIMNSDSSDTHHNYTQGQESDITLSIPNYLVSGNGISLTVYISSSCTYAFVLLSGNGTNLSPQIVLNQNHAGNVSRGSIAFAQMFSSWNGTNMDNVLKFDDWNTINIYNNSGTLNLNVNGTNTTNTSIQTGIKQFVLNCNPHVILGGISYFTGTSPVNTPYGTSNSKAYIDFSNMSSVSVKGDTSLSIVTNNLIDNNTIINIPQKTISSDSNIISYSYTNGYTGTYNITIPNYLASGTGISIVFYKTSNFSSIFHLLYDSVKGIGTPGVQLNLNQGTNLSNVNNVTLYADSVGSPQQYGYNFVYTSGMADNAWNTIKLYNNNGVLSFSVNGSNTTKTTFEIAKQFIASFTNNVVIASIAYTTSSSVNYPFNKDPNVTSYIDFADPNNPVVHGDQTQLVVTSKSLTAVTPIDNLPAIEITSTSNNISNKSIDNFDFIGNDLIVIGDEVQIFDNTLTQKYISSFISENKNIKNSHIDTTNSYIWTNMLSNGNYNIHSFKIDNYNLTSDNVYNTSLTDNDYIVSSYNNNGIYITKDSNSNNSLQTVIKINSASSDIEKNNIIYNGNTTLQNTIPTILTYSNYILEDQLDELLYSDFYRYHIWGSNVGSTQQTTPNQTFYQNIGKYVKIYNGKIFTYCESDTYDEKGNMTGYFGGTSYSGGTWGNIGSVINLYKGSDGNYRYGKKLFGNMPSPTTGFGDYNNISWLFGNMIATDTSVYISLFHALWVATNNSSIGYLTYPAIFRQDSSYTFKDLGIQYFSPLPSFLPYKAYNSGNFVIDGNNMYFSNWVNSYGTGLSYTTYNTPSSTWNSSISNETLSLYNGGKTYNMMYGANIGCIGNNLIITAYNANGSSLGNTINSTGTGTAYVYNKNLKLKTFLGNNDFPSTSLPWWGTQNMFAFMSINENGILFRNAYNGYNAITSSYNINMQYSYDSSDDSIKPVGTIAAPTDGGISPANYNQNISTLLNSNIVCDGYRTISGYYINNISNAKLLTTVSYPTLVNGTRYNYNVLYNSGEYSLLNSFYNYNNILTCLYNNGNYTYMVSYKISDTGYNISDIRPTFNTSSINNYLSYNTSGYFSNLIDGKITNIYKIDEQDYPTLLTKIKANNFLTSLYCDGTNIVMGNTQYYNYYNSNTLTDTGAFFYKKYNSELKSFISIPYKNGGLIYSNSQLSGNGGGYIGGSSQADGTGLTGGNGGLSYAPSNWTILESEYTNIAPASSDTDKNISGNGGTNNTKGSDGLVVITDNLGNKTLYGFTNSDQTYVVPTGVTDITVKIWGAGGGGSTTFTYYGGAGGYVTGNIQVSPSDIYTIMVGQGGISGSDLINNSIYEKYSYGYGSYGYVNDKIATGSGGGLSGIIHSGKIIAIAAGGGGAGIGQDGGSGKTTIDENSNDIGEPLSIIGNNFSNSRNSNDYFGWDTFIVDSNNILVSAIQNTGNIDGSTITNQSGCIWNYSLIAQNNGSSYWDISNKIIAPSNVYTYGSTINQYKDSYIIGSTLYKNDVFVTTLDEKFIAKGTSTINTSTDFILSTTSNLSKSLIVDTNGNNITNLPNTNRFSSETSDGLTNTGAVGIYSDNKLLQQIQETGPINGIKSNDYFGDGYLQYKNYILIGNNPSDSTRRKIQVFKDTGTSIDYVKDLVEPITVSNSYYGTIIKQNNDIISVYNKAGYLYNYKIINNDIVLTLTIKLSSSYNTEYNDIVSISDNTYIFGNPSDPRGSWTNQPNIDNAGTISIVSNNLTTRYYSVKGNSNGLAQTNDYFGKSVKFLNNKLFVVGSPGHSYDNNGNTLINTGAIYSYIITNGNIRNDSIITNAYSHTPFSGFGTIIKRSSDTSFVTGTSTNIVNIFNRISDNNWQSVNTFNIPVNSLADVYYDGNTLLVGNITNDYIKSTNSNVLYNLQDKQGGLAYYINNNSTWSRKTSYILDGVPFTGSTNSNYGYKIKNYNNKLVISAPNSTVDNKGYTVTSSSGNIYQYSMDTINGKAVLKSILSSDEYTGYGSILDLSKDGKTLIVGGKSNSYDTFDVIDTNNNSLQLTSNSKSVISDISISTDTISIGCDTYDNNSGIVELYTNKNNTWGYNSSLQAFINENVYDKNNPSSFTNSPAIVEGDYSGRSVYMNSKIGLVYSAIGNATDQQGNPVNPNSGAIFVVDVSKHLV